MGKEAQPDTIEILDGLEELAETRIAGHDHGFNRQPSRRNRGQGYPQR